MDDKKIKEKFVRNSFGFGRQKIQYWRREGLLPPGNRHGEKGYSFDELLAMRTIQGLLKEGLTVKKLKKGLDAITKREPEVQNPLAEKRLFVNRRDLCYFQEGKAIEACSGQEFIISPYQIKTSMVTEIARFEKGQAKLGKDRKCSKTG